jgi:hypothetical protein
MEYNYIQPKFKTIRDKKGIKFQKINKNTYNISFLLENKNCVLSSLVDFELMNLMYKLNSDVYESIEIEKISESESNITLILKKVFYDFLPQKYAYLNIKKSISNNTITFHSEIIKNSKPKCVNESLEPVNIDTILNTFEIVDNHKIIFDCNLIFNDNIQVPAIFDKLFAALINKMFLRFKQFIELLKPEY